MRTSLVLCVSLCFPGLPGPLRGGESPAVSAAEWLASRLPLRASEQTVARFFGRSVPQRSRNGDLVIMVFTEPPVGVAWPVHDHSHGGHADTDSCDSTPPWSFQFRDGGLLSAILTLPETRAAAEVLPDRKPLILRPAGEPISFAVWRLEDRRVLVAPGFEEPGDQVRQLLMLDETLLKVLYPKVAAALPQP